MTGDGNIYGLPECFLCSAISKSTASWGIDTFLTEVSVLGRERVSSPLGVLDVLFADGDGFVFDVEVAPQESGQLALAQSADQFQIEHGQQPLLSAASR